MLALYISLGVLAVLLVITAIIYNAIQKKKLRVENAFSQIKIQCRRRADLVPNFADIVKGIARQEDNALLKLRESVGDAITPQSLAYAEGDTRRIIGGLLAEADSSSSIKASVVFIQLQNELSNIEKTVSISRGFYNDAVMMYNRTISAFPINIFAKLFKFKKAEFYDPSNSDTHYMRGSRCPSCGAVSSSSICNHCGTRIPLI